MFDKLNKPDIELYAFKCQGKHFKNVYWSTCKRDLVVRDWNETETFDFQSETGQRPRPSHIFSRPRRDRDVWNCVSRPSRDRDRDVKTETTSLLVTGRSFVSRDLNRVRVSSSNEQWCGWGSFHEIETEGDTTLTRPRQARQLIIRPRQGSQKTVY